MRKDFGCLLFDVEKHFPDHRGYFTEFYRKQSPELKNIGFPPITQTNVSMSSKNTLRGMHFNTRKPQAKMVRVLQGEIIDVVVDLRLGSPNYGIVELYRLNTPQQCLLVPAGYAHGFWSLSDNTLLIYGCSEIYDPKNDCGLSLLDKGFDFPWHGVFDTEAFVVNDQDLNWPKFDLEKPVFGYSPEKRFRCLVG